MGLDRRMLEPIHRPEEYAEHVNNLANDDDADKAIEHANKWCDTHMTELRSIFATISDDERKHPHNLDELGRPKDLTFQEWALSKYFIWEFNVMAQQITDTMFSDIDSEIDALIHGEFNF